MSPSLNTLTVLNATMDTLFIPHDDSVYSSDDLRLHFSEFIEDASDDDKKTPIYSLLSDKSIFDSIDWDYISERFLIARMNEYDNN